MTLKSEKIFESNSTTENSFEQIESNLTLQKESKISQLNLHTNENISEDDYLKNINRVIEDLISESESEANQKNKNLKNKIGKNENFSNNSIFHMKNLPKIFFKDYLLRINQYLKPEKSTILLALMYIDDLYSNSKANLIISWTNIFKVFLTAIVIAIKFNEDEYDSNSTFAKVGGIPLEELNKLEIEFCKLMKFGFFVDLKSFKEYKIFLENF
jgi:hypothetical protein